MPMRLMIHYYYSHQQDIVAKSGDLPEDRRVTGVYPTILERGLRLQSIGVGMMWQYGVQDSEIEAMMLPGACR